MIYDFGEADGAGEALGEADSFFSAFFSVRLAFAASFFACSAAVGGPSFTVFASSDPSTCFQYEPATSSPATISFIVAGAPVFDSAVLSFNLNVREVSRPAMVNVFAFGSTAEIFPWNGIGRIFAAAEAAGEGEAFADGDAEALAAGEGLAVSDFLARAAADAVSGRVSATAATHAAVMI